MKQEIEKEEPVSVSVDGLADALTKYIKDKHTQEECIGYSDGFKEAKEQDKKLISELLEVLKGDLQILEQTLIHRNHNNMIGGNLFLLSQIEQTESAITKATEYINKTT